MILKKMIIKMIIILMYNVCTKKPQNIKDLLVKYNKIILILVVYYFKRKPMFIKNVINNYVNFYYHY